MTRFIFFFITFSLCALSENSKFLIPFSQKAHATYTATQVNLAQKIADHFTQIRSMTGNFVQFSHNGEEASGNFFIQRPGKLHFNYQKPTHYQIISDSQSIVILNKNLRTSDLYPLSATPLKFLLDNHIDLSKGLLKSTKEEADEIFIELGEKSSAGHTKILMVFNSLSYDLKRWILTDNKGEETTVLLFNTKKNVNIDPSVFTINYTINREFNEKESDH